jgi:plastocyanin
MRRRYAFTVVVAALALGGVGLMPSRSGTPAALAQATAWQVLVGRDVVAESIGVNAYFPRALTVRSGDTVDFTIAGFHTVTFNGGRPPLEFIMPGPGAGELTLGSAFFPAGPVGADNSVTFDGATQISSGTPLAEGEGEPQPFRVTFTRPGIYSYLCMVHSGMEGVITVQPVGGVLPETPADAVARGVAEREAVIAEITAGAAMTQSAHTAAPGGGTVHTLVAGLGTASGGSALRFLPGDLTVRRGDVVTWTTADPMEIHTVTFLSGAPTPAEVEVRQQPSGAPLVVIPASVAAPAGGGAYTGQGYVNSGLLTNGGSFALRFDAPPGTYEYRCLIHSGAVAEAGGSPSMISRIVVTE